MYSTPICLAVSRRRSIRRATSATSVHLRHSQRRDLKTTVAPVRAADGVPTLDVTRIYPRHPRSFETAGVHPPVFAVTTDHSAKLLLVEQAGI